jgi:hypothetical protein
MNYNIFCSLILLSNFYVSDTSGHFTVIDSFDGHSNPVRWSIFIILIFPWEEIEAWECYVTCPESGSKRSTPGLCLIPPLHSLPWDHLFHQQRVLERAVDLWPLFVKVQCKGPGGISGYPGEWLRPGHSRVDSNLRAWGTILQTLRVTVVDVEQKRTDSEGHFGFNPCPVTYWLS